QLSLDGSKPGVAVVSARRAMPPVSSVASLQSASPPSIFDRRPRIVESTGMSTGASEDVASEPGGFPARARATSRWQVGVRALIALVVCCGAVFWAWRVVWDQRHPLLAAVRGLQARDPSQRLAAVREVMNLSFGQRAVAIESLSTALGDPDRGVRAAAAQALGLVASHA